MNTVLTTILFTLSFIVIILYSLRIYIGNHAREISINVLKGLKEKYKEDFEFKMALDFCYEFIRGDID